MLETNKIYNGDCLEVMKQIPDNSVDLIITSPPYNLSNNKGGGFKNTENDKKWKNALIANGYDTYSDDMPYEQYVEWQIKCVNEMYRLIKDTGAIFYNNKNRIQNGVLQNRWDIVAHLPVRQIIVWQRSGCMNFNDTYFGVSTEQIYVIAKQQFKLKPKANAILDVWKINQSRDIDHPAPFPIELPDRIIKSCECKTVLDPFIGSGTTALACIENGVKFVGIEISEKYCKYAEERIKIKQKETEIRLI